ncbi:putative protein, unknown function, partial [Plasmodium gaboni]
MKEKVPPYLKQNSTCLNDIVDNEEVNDEGSEEFKSTIDEPIIQENNVVEVNNECEHYILSDSSFDESRYSFSESIISSYSSSRSSESVVINYPFRTFTIYRSKRDIYALLNSFYELPNDSDIMRIWYKALYVARYSTEMKENLKNYMWCYFAKYPKNIICKYKECIDLIGRKFSNEISFRMYPYIIKYNRRFRKLVQSKAQLYIIVNFIYNFTEFLDAMKKEIYLKYKRDCFKYICVYFEK